MTRLRARTEAPLASVAVGVVAAAVGGVATIIDVSSLSVPVVAALAAVVGLALSVAFAQIVRSAVHIGVGELHAQPKAADEGALILDYVKPTSLAALAQQLGVDTPERLEQLESSTSDLTAKAGAPGAELGLGQQEMTQVTRLYERSLNALAGHLLAALETDEILGVRRDLALLPASQDREVLAHLEALEQLGINLGDGAPTPEEIRGRFETEVADTKRNAYQRVASADRVPLVLVEGRWLVVEGLDAMTLKLAELVPDDGTNPQAMPDGVGLHASFEKTLRTDMGSGRLLPSDHPTPATILGAPAGMTGNILSVNPVIIFTRYGGRRQFSETPGGQAPRRSARKVPTHAGLPSA